MDYLPFWIAVLNASILSEFAVFCVVAGNLNFFLISCSNFQATLVAAESKREEEKAKGVNVENGAENPDIVPFDDNEEEEEEEESEEEDENFIQAPGLAMQGRGRGRGMWPPNFPMGRGMRPIPGMRGFSPGMMGVDGFAYGPGPGPGPDSFPLPDPFGMGPRPFVPYGPRFSGDFSNPAPGMMFPGRPSQPGGVLSGGGFGMMIGPGRGPFMPGMGMGGRGGRPMGMPPIFPPQPGPPQSGNRGPKRDPRGSGNDLGEAFGSGPEQGKLLDAGGGRADDMQYQQGSEKFVPRNITNDESESEDEAPRRSRHGEGKKKRRSLDGDGHAVDP